MKVFKEETERSLKLKKHESDLTIIGGGMAGTCCALTAARAGIKVTLVQDRPVLGGNGSSEVRLWILGATSHMSNNNRWAREGGVIDEILVENTHRNPEGNPIIFDTILLEKVLSEKNITLLLNTAVFELKKKDRDRIESVKAFCSQNSTIFELKSPLFCDASGDGIVGFMSGAAFRMGAESNDEFGEKFAPTIAYGELLGHSLYFYSKDTGKPVEFTAPSYAISEEEVEQIARFRKFGLGDQGCHFWWIEYGGRLDTVHKTEEIKWKLWSVVYGIWNYFKNSGKFPEAKSMTLEWVGYIPGKRESRRYEGDYILRQQDVVEQNEHFDAVSYGGWALDLHPADGVYAKQPGCDQWHSKGVYQIPFRCMYSRNVKNLFLAGRIISATHVAFGSTRVMATCSHNAQAVGMAAALCTEKNLEPCDIIENNEIENLKRRLLRFGQYIPKHPLIDESDLVQNAEVTASSSLKLRELDGCGPWLKLDYSWAMLVPLKRGKCPSFSFRIKSTSDTQMSLELRRSSKRGNFTPDIIVDREEIQLRDDEQMDVSIQFEHVIEETSYYFICLMANENIKIRCSEQRITGVLSVTNKFNYRVARNNIQEPPENSGLDRFEFWRPLRRPAGHNISFSSSSPIYEFVPSHIKNGYSRPTNQPNAWVAAYNDKHPQLFISFGEAKTIKRIELDFDTDFDHPMESALMGHPERTMPFCIKNYVIKTGNGDIVYKKLNNYQTRNIIELNQPIETEKLVIEVEHPSSNIPASLFSVRCYEC